MNGYDHPLEASELELLADAYGPPEIRTIDIESDEYLFATRLYRVQDRRGEVVLAIERPGHRILLHRKGWYEPNVYRLLTGGIDLDEPVQHTLVRELEEETGLTPHTTRFLGVLDCRLHFGSQQITFASYVFHLPCTHGTLRLPQTEEISAFRQVGIADLPQVAESLRLVPPPRRGWGHWRAIAHDFVYEMLSQAAKTGLSSCSPSERSH